MKQSYIKRGICEDPENCAVALALKAHGFIGVTVLGDSWSGVYKHAAYDRPLPKKVTRFIGRFDKRKATKPISFSISL